MRIYIHIHIHTYVYINKARCGDFILTHFMLKYSVSLRRDAAFQKSVCFIVGNTTFENKPSSQAIYMFSNVCVVSLLRNNTFSMPVLTRKDPWVTKNHRENQTTKQTKTRFQYQWVAETIEKTTKNKQHKQLFQYQWVSKTIEKTKRHIKITRFQYQCFGFTTIDPDCFCLVFSMALATHWS